MRRLNLLLAGTLLFLTSCGVQTYIVDTSCPKFKSENFSRTMITEKGIGIMPVLGGDDKEEFRRPMGESLNRNMKLEFGSTNVKSTLEVVNKLNEDSLTDEYTSALKNYSATGIIPKKMVQNLGKSLAVDYLLYSRLINDGEYRYFNTGYNSVKIEVDEIYIQSQIWDTKIGDVVWEGKGGVAKLATYKGNLVEKTAEGLIRVIGKDKYDGPCESKDKIYTSAKVAFICAYVGLGLVFMAIVSY
jgi:hypothetical protein